MSAVSKQSEVAKNGVWLSNEKIDQLAYNFSAMKRRGSDVLDTVADISITVEKINMYRTYRIESIRIDNTSQNTIRLRKTDLVGLKEGRTISIKKTILKKGGYTNAIRLILG